ncbi:hypothetical protein [Kitasatospora sp. NPDC059599]|uniref:hypothetical protein n=1 Tax=Kitasatospora sp. NPDC059599 TaxID=3346880 RepID=UPI0036CAA840
MTIVAAFRPARPSTRPSTDRGRTRAALAALAAVGRRLAASPPDHAVLQAAAASAVVPAATPAGDRTSGMRARWRTATAPDGTTRLEATWHPAR